MLHICESVKGSGCSVSLSTSVCDDKQTQFQFTVIVSLLRDIQNRRRWSGGEGWRSGDGLWAGSNSKLGYQPRFFPCRRCDANVVVGTNAYCSVQNLSDGPLTNVRNYRCGIKYEHEFIMFSIMVESLGTYRKLLWTLHASRHRWKFLLNPGPNKIGKENRPE